MGKIILIAVLIIGSLITFLIMNNGNENLAENIKITPSEIDKNSIMYVSDQSGNWDLWIYNLKSKKRSQITAHRSPDYYPSYSKVNNKVLFTTYRWQGHRLGVLDIESGNVVKLLDNANYNLQGAWSFDGSKVVFFMLDGSYWQLFMCNSDGSNLKKISSVNASERAPSWHPNGKTIVFQSSRDGNWEIYSMDIESDHVMRLTHDSEEDFAPSYSRSGKYITFASSRDGFADVFTMKSDGTQQINLTNGQPNKSSINSESHKDDVTPMFSSDDTQIIFSSNISKNNSDIFIIELATKNITRITENNYDDRFAIWLQ